MIKLLHVLVFLFLIIESKAQLCTGDSVVIKHRKEMDYYGSGGSHTIETDSFNTNSGICISCSQHTFHGVMGNLNCSQSTFNRRFLTLSPLGDTLNYFLFNGTGTGFTNNIRIEYTYTSSGKKLSRLEYKGVNLLWQLTCEEFWTYSASEDILTYEKMADYGNGNLDNEIRKTYSYNGSQLNDIVYEAGSGLTWVPETKYIYSYLSGRKDSVLIENWDQQNLIWVISNRLKFDPANNYRYVIFSSQHDTLGNLMDTLYREVDTLNNAMYEYAAQLMTDEYIHDLYYEYVGNGFIKPSYGYTDDAGCINDGGYSYDIHGVFIGWSGSSHCFHPATSSWYKSYDGLYRPTYYHSQLSNMVGDSESEEHYHYADANQINISYVDPDEIDFKICKGDTIKPISIIYGGCGPYHIQWTPSTNLSSDTVAEPDIIINSPITYTITITDTTGHSSNTTFTATPSEFIYITYDSTLCYGCPAILYASYVNNYTYQWYYNGTLIPGATADTFVVDTSGYYSVIANAPNLHCEVVSDSVFIPVGDLTRLMGTIYLDNDSDCSFSAGDTTFSIAGIHPLMVRFEKSGYVFYDMVDAAGHFNVPAGPGTYSISLENSPGSLNLNCPQGGSYTAVISSFNDTVSGLDFFLVPDMSCSSLGVNVTAGIFRPCRQISIVLNYYNEGIAYYSNPVIDVTLPPELTIVFSPVPYTVLPGNVYRFSVPALNAFEHEVLIISADVVCNPALANATLCIDAEISPANFCTLQPDSTWDGSNVRVKSFCQNPGDVCFTISNEGLAGGNMSSASSWRLYGDNTLIQQGSFLLNASADTTLCFSSDGRTFRLEVDQTAGFPVVSAPNAQIERCGILPVGHTYSLNQILQHQPDNNIPFYYTYCNRVVASSDPNGKSVKPEGWGSGHFVSNNSILNYRIDFQNTGTDTAFTVEIIDSIDTAIFDIASLELIGSNHSYEFALDDQHILHWKFDNILLPDSNTDEPFSHGYVEFRLHAKPQAIGTLISNTAQIYFDFNPPVSTGAVTNIVCDELHPDVLISLDYPTCDYTSANFTATVINGGTSPEVHWYVNGNFSGVGLNWQATGLSSGDSINCILYSSYLCANPANVAGSGVFVSVLPTITFNQYALTSSAGVSYQWYLGGNLLPGQTTQTIIPSSAGNYSVEVADSNGCVNMSALFYFSPTGIRTIDSFNGVLFPQPADAFLNLKGFPDKSEFLITDIAGNEVRKFNIKNDSQQSFTLPTGNFTPGFYFLIGLKDNVFREKILIVHE